MLKEFLTKYRIGDPVLQGTIIGLIATLVQDFYAVIALMLGVRGPFYWDYGKVLLFQRDDQGWLLNSLGLISHWVWDTILSIIFVYLIRNASKRLYAWKGVLYGVVVWYFINTSANILRIPVISGVKPIIIVFFFIGAVIYGLVVAYSLKLIALTGNRLRD